MRVVVVEDDRDQRMILGALLTGIDVDMFPLPSAVPDDVLAAADVVVTDWLMAGECGADLVARAADLCPDARVYILSGMAAEILRDGQAGGATVLSKPMPPTELVETIRGG